MAGLHTNSPIISIGMPVFNGSRYIRGAIDSIIGQSFTDFEMIISDNASVDSTQEICEEYVRKDPRIQYIRQETNMGGPRNWNYVFKRSRGLYFKWASANDICHPEFLACCKEILDQRPDVILCYPKTKIIDENGIVVENYEDNMDIQDPSACVRFIKFMTQINLNNAQNGLIRSNVLHKTVLEGIYPGGDIPLMAELILHGKFYEIPEYLFYRRISPDAATIGRRKSEMQQFIDPDGRKPVYVPYWRSGMGFINAVYRSPVTLVEKVRIYYFLAKALYWNREALRKELVDTWLGRMG